MGERWPTSRSTRTRRRSSAGATDRARGDALAVDSPPRRAARLVLCDRDERVLGVLPPVAVRTPWWQDISPVVEAAGDAFGLDVAVLRLLESELARPNGGVVTYLAEATEPLTPAADAALEAWDG